MTNSLMVRIVKNRQGIIKVKIEYLTSQWSKIVKKNRCDNPVQEYTSTRRMSTLCIEKQNSEIGKTCQVSEKRVWLDLNIKLNIQFIRKRCEKSHQTHVFLTQDLHLHGSGRED